MIIALIAMAIVIMTQTMTNCQLRRNIKLLKTYVNTQEELIDSLEKAVCIRDAILKLKMNR